MGGGLGSQKKINGTQKNLDAEEVGEVVADSFDNRLNKVKPEYYTDVRLNEDDIRLAKIAWGIIMSPGSSAPFQKLKSEDSVNFKHRTSIAWFYDEFSTKFFKLCPQASSYANADIVIHGKLVAGLITTVLKYVDDPENLRHQLANNATIYSHKGVKSDHYSSMGTALFESLELVIGKSNSEGPSFDEPTKNAWIKVYSSMLDIMLPVAVQYEIDQETNNSNSNSINWAGFSRSKENSPRQKAPSIASSPAVPPRKGSDGKPPALVRQRSVAMTCKPSDATMRVNLGMEKRHSMQRHEAADNDTPLEAVDDGAGDVEEEKGDLVDNSGENAVEGGNAVEVVQVTSPTVMDVPPVEYDSEEQGEIQQRRTSILGALPNVFGHNNHHHNDHHSHHGEMVQRAPSHKVVLTPSQSELQLYHSGDFAIEPPERDPSSFHKQFSEFDLEPAGRT